MTARVYEVIGPYGPPSDAAAPPRVLVRAISPAQALRHVVEDRFAVRVANAIQVVDYVTAGGVVQDATARPAPAPEPQRDPEMEDES